MVTAICCLLLGSCDDDDDDSKVVTKLFARHADMTVVVPIHPSSLEFFDYVINYRDNQGLVQNDTIQNVGGGIVVEDWATKDALTSDCYIRTFCYNDIPIACYTTVTMIPKGDDGMVGPFSFYIPKPYIFPSIHGSVAPDHGETPNLIPEGVECIQIDSMPLSKFQSTYGTTYVSRCSINDSEDGYEVSFY